MLVKTWQHTSAADAWTDPAAWSPTGAPTTADDVLFDSMATGTLDQVTGGGTARSLTVLGDAVTLQSGSITLAADAGSLVVGGGGSLQIGGTETLAGISGLIGSAGTGSVGVSGTLDLGTLAIGTQQSGTLSAVGGTISAGTTELGALGTLSLDPASVYQGGTITVEGGRIVAALTAFGNGGVVTLSAPIAFTGSRSHLVTGSSTLVLTGPLTGAGGIEEDNASRFGGSVELAGANPNLSGTVYLDAGNLTLDTLQAAGTGDIVFGAGSINGPTVLDVRQLGNLANRLDHFTTQPNALLIEDEALTFVAGMTTAMIQGGQLVVTNGTQTATFTVDGAADGTTYAVTHNQAGATFVIACYCPGTRIATPGGEVAIEHLAIGDPVLTHDGAARPIRWIGRRSYAGRFLAGNPAALPVRITAGALGAGLPRRDLLVSPLHAMLIDGVLVPAHLLVDGVAIRRERAAERVDYLHLDLGEHTAIWAEGAASESFIDDDSRAMFQNAASFAAAYPDEPDRPARYCAPRVTGGAALHQILCRLRHVARQAA